MYSAPPPFPFRTYRPADPAPADPGPRAGPASSRFHAKNSPLVQPTSAGSAPAAGSVEHTLCLLVLNTLQVEPEAEDTPWVHVTAEEAAAHGFVSEVNFVSKSLSNMRNDPLTELWFKI